MSPREIEVEFVDPAVMVDDVADVGRVSADVQAVEDALSVQSIFDCVVDENPSQNNSAHSPASQEAAAPPGTQISAQLAGSQEPGEGEGKQILQGKLGGGKGARQSFEAAMEAYIRERRLHSAEKTRLTEM